MEKNWGDTPSATLTCKNEYKWTPKTSKIYKKQY